ncbi:hypothetical protein LDENG_00018970 [Lucifuga dentata]|nr:hypothetical protein LDENG_00018970 [Lucifuga dentata]
MFTAANDETISGNCSSEFQRFERLSAELQTAVECGNKLQSHWSPNQTAALLLSMRNLTDSLHKHQLKECQHGEPKNCSAAEVPTNGGLTCVTVNNKRYCKPLCNHGYDFNFIKRSRFYEQCSKETGYKWTTQYVGGNKLAVCISSPIQVSGVKTSYFPQDQDCLRTKTSSQLENHVIDTFKAELKNQGVLGKPNYACLTCG